MKIYKKIKDVYFYVSLYVLILIEYLIMCVEDVFDKVKK